MSDVNLKSEFSRLKDVCYLDHAGTALYADSQVDAVCAHLKTNLLGNPHSLNLSSQYCRDAVDQIRYRILKHFNTTEDEYSVVFTSGTTSGLQSVVEWFDWGEGEDGGEFVYLRDVHTSVLGLREIVAKRSAKTVCLEHEDAFERFRNASFSGNKISATSRGRSLFVFPAMCNFSGCKYPLDWIEKTRTTRVLDNFLADIHRAKMRNPHWFSLLDAASFVPTNNLDLNMVRPDFVVFSFYKIFGYPTGLGVLLIRKSSKSALRKSYYGGGTILMAFSDENKYIRRPTCHEWFEDGTINYLSIVSVRHGFETLEHLGGTMEQISDKVFHLTQYLHQKLTRLHHANGQKVVKMYRDTDYDDSTTQGGILNFNLKRPNGAYIGYLKVMHVANSYGIYLRTGCFCNPGACQRHLKLTNAQLLENYDKGHTCADNIDLIDGRPTGSIRISFGYVSDETDADYLLKMITECFIEGPAILKTPEDWHEKSRRLKKKFCGDENKNSEDIITERLFPKKNVAWLKKIYVYPIKSCGAFDVPKSWPLTRNGLKYDRDWMIISEDGVVMTQKHLPQMCLIVPSIDLDRGILYLHFQDSSIHIPLNNELSECSTVSTHQSKVCQDKVSVIDCGNRVSEWLASQLNKSGIRLVKLMTRNKKGCNSHRDLSLANQAQYLLITKPSVRWLQGRIQSRSDSAQESLCKQFRSNFIIDGEFEALEEFEWDSIRIGSCQFQINGPCTRCQMVCINQSSGEWNREPLTALSASLNGPIQFGIYMTHIPIDITMLNINDEVLTVRRSSTSEMSREYSLNKKD